MRNIKQLVVHCSATPEGVFFNAKDIDRWHRGPPNYWNGIGYHFVILLDGKIETGRPVAQIGSHVKGHNAESIGICLIGGTDQMKRAKNTFTPAQFQSLNDLLDDLQERFPGAEILGHRDFPNVHKDCPSFDVRAWRARVKSGAMTL